MRQLARLDPRFRQSASDRELWECIGVATFRTRAHIARAYDPVVEIGTDPRIAADAHFLSGAQLVHYVADSQPERREANIEGLQRFMSTMARLGRPPQSVPILIQLNKRDLPSPTPVEILRDELRWPAKATYVSTSAAHGEGLVELLAAVLECLL